MNKNTGSSDENPKYKVIQQMHKILLRAFVLLGFTTQAFAPLAAATIKSETTVVKIVAKQDMGQAYNPRGQRHQLARYTATRSANLMALYPSKPPQISDNFIPTHGTTRSPNLTKNDRTGNLRLAQDYSKPLSSQENRTPKKTAEGTCARCAENFPICVYNATLYSNKKTEALRKRHAMNNCIIREDECLKKCK